jgi:hypothetical protein
MALVDNGEARMSFHFACQGCGVVHHPHWIRKSKGCCQRCHGEIWLLEAHFTQSGSELVAVVPFPVLVVVSKHMTAQNRFRCEDIPRETVLFLAADDRLVEERIKSFMAAKSQAQRVAHGAKNCRVCGTLFEHLVHKPWFDLGCCSKSCGAKVSERDADHTTAAKQLRPPIRVSCAGGHSFEVPDTYAGCHRPCPECGTKCLVV